MSTKIKQGQTVLNNEASAWNFEETVFPVQQLILLQEAAATVYPIPDGVQICCPTHI